MAMDYVDKRGAMDKSKDRFAMQTYSYKQIQNKVAHLSSDLSTAPIYLVSLINIIHSLYYYNHQ